MYRTILLAYDGSRECRLALREGAEIARLAGSSVLLLSVMPVSLGVALGEGFSARTIIEKDLERYQQVLDEGIERLRSKGITATGHLVSGDPAGQIVQCARQFSADLVVLGHVARRGLARWWRSSVGANLLDELDCSVLVAVWREDRESA